MSAADHATLAALTILFWVVLPALILWRGRERDAERGEQ